MSKAKGTRRHDFRIGKLPEYVKKDRVHLNRILMKMRPLPQIKRENAELRKMAGRQRAMKSNAAVITSGIITFGSTAARMFESLALKKQEAAFLELAQSIAAELDTKLEALVIHRDESTVHAHFMLRSYTHAGLAVSEISKRGTMSRLQALAAKVMQEYHPDIERGHRKWNRIEAGADYADTLHRSVRELHRDLPAELDALRQERADGQAALAEISKEIAAQQTALDAILHEKDAILAEQAAAAEAAEAALAESIHALAEREEKLAQQERRQREQADVAQANAENLEARAAEISERDEQITTARTELVAKAEEVRAQKGKLDASVAAIDHVLASLEAGQIQLRDNGKITMDDPAPLYAAPKSLRVRLLPSITRLVHKIDETERQASLVEENMERVRRFLSRSDLPKDVEDEARGIEADWTP